jgi:hypothetical protein
VRSFASSDDTFRIRTIVIEYSMTNAEIVGWTAAALMVATFSCRDALWMRRLAVCTNLAFICYALLASLAPILALHSLLLPINLWRYWQCICERSVASSQTFQN